MKVEKNLPLGIALIVISALLTSIGQLVWKLASIKSNSLLLYILGFILYGVGAIVMIVSFSFGDLSVLHPMLSLGFIFGLFWSVLFLKEALTLNKILGIMFIIIGTFSLGLQSEEKKNE